MTKSDFKSIIFLVCFLVFNSVILAQQEREEKKNKQIHPRFGTEIRGANALSLGIGVTIPNGDLSDPIFELYSYVNYKRFLGKYINLNLGYHKFNIAYKDVFNEGFMSFDANLEFNAFPNNIFNIFMFGGAGLNASNYFESTSQKVQGGGGVELLITESVGFVLFGELNKLFTDDLEGVVSGNADDLYWRMAFGVNFYFGKRGRKKRIKKGEPTIINSNPIIH